MKDILSFTTYYGSFLAFPFLATVSWQFIKNEQTYLLAFLIILSLFFIWSRFIEPQIIVVKKVKGPANFVLLSDIHLGQYKGDRFFTRVIDKINALNPDFVLIPGDFVYSINPKKIEKLFAPLAELKVPIYAVLGNHDMSPAGELLDSSFSEILSKYGVIWLDNKSIIQDDIQIIGLGELWNHQTDLSTLKKIKPELKNIIMVHNPDATHLFPKKVADLVVSGHTHGGQIRIPLIYRLIIPTKHNWGSAKGWYEILGNPLYITSGIGEVVLPMRLFCPPEIVLFETN